MRYVLDTHVWIWWNAKPESLPKKLYNVISQGEYTELLLSSISVWEFSKLLEKGRFRVSMDGKQWIDEALTLPRLRLAPLTPEIAWTSTQLPAPFHEDPADQIIVATARIENATLLTADKLILKYPHVRCLK